MQKRFFCRAGTCTASWRASCTEMETPQGCSGLRRRASQVASSAELTAQLQRRRDEQAAASTRRKLQDTVQRCAMLKPLAEVRDRTLGFRPRFGQKPQQSYCVRNPGWCTPRETQRSRKCSQTRRQTHIFCAHVNLYFCVVRFLLNARFWNLFVFSKAYFLQPALYWRLALARQFRTREQRK